MFSQDSFLVKKGVNKTSQDQDESSWGESMEQENRYLTENEYPIGSMLSKLKGQQHVFGQLYHNYAIMLILQCHRSWKICFSLLI